MSYNSTPTLIAEITGNVTDQAMIMEGRQRGWSGGGIEAGGMITLGTATTADVTVKDASGKELHNATVTADTPVDPVAHGVTGPLTVTVAEISDAAHTLTVRWKVRQ